MATYDDFLKLDIRVGKIVAVEDVPDSEHECILIVPDKNEAMIGGKLF